MDVLFPDIPNFASNCFCCRDLSNPLICSIKLLKSFNAAIWAVCVSCILLNSVSKRSCSIVFSVFKLSWSVDISVSRRFCNISCSTLAISCSDFILSCESWVSNWSFAAYSSLINRIRSSDPFSNRACLSCILLMVFELSSVIAFFLILKMSAWYTFSAFNDPPPWDLVAAASFNDFISVPFNPNKASPNFIFPFCSFTAVVCWFCKVSNAELILCKLFTAFSNAAIKLSTGSVLVCIKDRYLSCTEVNFDNWPSYADSLLCADAKLSSKGFIVLS